MRQFFKRWLERLFSRTRDLVARGREQRRKGWLEGSYSDPRGTLYYLPLLQPKRDYRLYLPAQYHPTKKRPLVVMLHGCKQDPQTFAESTRMNELADRHGFLVLYPEQRRFANTNYCWNWFDSSVHRGGGEAALIAGMVREITASYAVDEDRVYVAGLSAGGAMTSILASCYGKLFAACAVHSGLMYRAADSVAEATKAMKHGSGTAPAEAARQGMQQEDFDFVPAVVIHGNKDETVDIANADQVVEQFLFMARHGDDAQLAESSNSRTSSGGYRYDIHDYMRGGRVLLRKVVVEGMDHAWSGGDPKHPFNDPKGPDASLMIWEFFSAHSRKDSVGLDRAAITRTTTQAIAS